MTSAVFVPKTRYVLAILLAFLLLPLMLILFLAVGAAISALCAGTVLGPAVGWFAAAVAAALIYLVIDRTRYRAFLNRVSATDLEPRAAVAALTAGRKSNHPAEQIGWLGALLVRERRMGTTIRIAPADKQPAIRPLAVPIEPLPLDETVESFAHIAEHGVSADGGKPVPRARRDYASWIIVAVAAVALVSELRRIARTGSARWQGALWVAVLVPAVYSVLGKQSRTYRLLAVNGGLLHRGGWLRSTARVHLFTPSSSVLIVACTGERWLCSVHDAAFPDGKPLLLTTAEAEVLLRAWYSSLPPPPMERLSDFG